MKKLFVIVLAAFIAIPAFSQINFGLKAGLSTTSITMEDVKTIASGGTSYTVEKLKGANYGFHGGVFVRLNISKLYIQPELLFSNRSNEYTVTNLASVTDSIVKQKFNKLDIPVMVGVKFGPLRLNAGPSASLLINSPADLIKDPDFKTMYSRMTFGYQAGIGLDLLKKLTIDLRYEGSLKKYQNQIENLVGTSVALDDRPNAFLLSIGYIF
ncbi:MAG: PorT family protein [Bacteroidales bacterium]|nr:PorT family protein [Bacteroidales bacterium]